MRFKIVLAAWALWGLIGCKEETDNGPQQQPEPLVLHIEANCAWTCIAGHDTTYYEYFGIGQASYEFEADSACAIVRAEEWILHNRIIAWFEGGDTLTYLCDGTTLPSDRNEWRAGVTPCGYR